MIKEMLSQVFYLPLHSLLKFDITAIAARLTPGQSWVLLPAQLLASCVTLMGTPLTSLSLNLHKLKMKMVNRQYSKLTELWSAQNEIIRQPSFV